MWSIRVLSSLTGEVFRLLVLIFYSNVNIKFRIFYETNYLTDEALPQKFCYLLSNKMLHSVMTFLIIVLAIRIVLLYATTDTNYDTRPYLIGSDLCIFM